MAMVKVSSKCQIVMPKKVRDALGIKPKQKVLIKVVKDHAEIIPLPKDPVKEFCGIFRKGPPLIKALLKARKEARVEEKKAS